MRRKDSTELNPDPILKLCVSLKLFVCGAQESKSRKPVGITWEPWPMSFNFLFVPIIVFHDFRSPHDPTAVTCTTVRRHSGHSAAGPAQFHSLGRCTRTFRVSSSGVLGAVGDNLMQGWKRWANAERGEQGLFFFRGVIFCVIIVCWILGFGMEGPAGECVLERVVYEQSVMTSNLNAKLLTTTSNINCSFGNLFWSNNMALVQSRLSSQTQMTFPPMGPPPCSFFQSHSQCGRVFTWLRKNFLKCDETHVGVVVGKGNHPSGQQATC